MVDDLNKDADAKNNAVDSVEKIRDLEKAINSFLVLKLRSSTQLSKSNEDLSRAEREAGPRGGPKYGH